MIREAGDEQVERRRDAEPAGDAEVVERRVVNEEIG